MKSHPTEIGGYEGKISELAAEVGRLRYDKLWKFIDSLKREIERQEKNDRENGRPHLAEQLATLSTYLGMAGLQSQQAFQLCEQYMTDEIKKNP